MDATSTAAVDRSDESGRMNSGSKASADVMIKSPFLRRALSSVSCYEMLQVEGLYLLFTILHVSLLLRQALYATHSPAFIILISIH